MRFVVLAVFSASLIPLVAHPDSLIVPSQYPTIQSAIDAAAEGDSILISPGTYQETLSWENKDLTILGLGATPTVTASRMSRVVNIGSGVTRETVIANLTFRDGKAEEGAGMQLMDASPCIQLCRFESNDVIAIGAASRPTRGGALFVSSSSTPLVTDCVFLQNRSLGSVPDDAWWGDGGAVYVQPFGSIELRRCLFQQNVAQGSPEGGRGGGVHLNGEATAVIDSCTFDRNFGYGGGVWSMWDVEVRNCVFAGNMGWSGAAFYSSYGTYSLDHNLFYNNDVAGGEGGTIWAAGQGSIVNNTIAFNIGRYDYAEVEAPDARFTHNIICNNEGWAVHCGILPAVFTCNNVWGNELDGSPTNYYGGCDPTDTNGNISSDPLFCDPDNRDLSLHKDSPCAGGAPSTCGLIGALGVGCTVTAIAETQGSPARLQLLASPNPGFGSTRFLFDLTDSGKASLRIYDLGGRLVRVLADVLLPAGHHMVPWDGRNAQGEEVGVGVYFWQLDVNEKHVGRDKVVITR